MKKPFKISMFLMLCTAFASVITSCAKNEPDIVVMPHSISGSVINRSGYVLSGVELTLNNGEKATTDNFGYYVFPDVPIGNYIITATKEWYIEEKTYIKIGNEPESMNAIWNVTLYKLGENVPKDDEPYNGDDWN